MKNKYIIRTIFCVAVFTLMLFEVKILDQDFNTSNQFKISFISAEASMGGNLECGDVSGCKGSSNCGSPGTQSGCVLNCEGGGTVICDIGDQY